MLIDPILLAGTITRRDAFLFVEYPCKSMITTKTYGNLLAHGNADWIIGAVENALSMLFITFSSFLL